MKKIEAAGAVILNENNEILLMHRNLEDMNQWELPGGKKETDETMEQTAIRELKEELDVDICIEKDLGFKEFEFNNAILKYHWYKAKIVSGTPKLVEERFDELKYFSKSELLKINNLSANMKVMLENIDIENI